ncbi:unnamed protein product [[Candida] boidinii]|nr:unnamed protein product [[Candida] boidinii]
MFFPHGIVATAIEPTNDGIVQKTTEKAVQFFLYNNTVVEITQQMTPKPPDATETKVESKFEILPISSNKRFCWYGKLLASCCKRKNKPNNQVIGSFKASTN